MSIVILLFAETLTIGVKIFRKDSKIFLINIYSYFEAKNLKNALNNSCQERCPQPQYKGNRLSFRITYVKNNLFILINNIIINYWTIAIDIISYNK